MNFNIIQQNTPKLSYYKGNSPEIGVGSYLFYYIIGTSDGGIEFRCGYKTFRLQTPTVTSIVAPGVEMDIGNATANDGAENADFAALIQSGGYVFKPSSVLFPIEYIEKKLPTSYKFSVLSSIPLNSQLQKTLGYYISCNKLINSYNGYNGSWPTLIPNLSGTKDPSFKFTQTQWKSLQDTADWFNIPTVNYNFAGGTTHCCLLFLANNNATKDSVLVRDNMIKTISTANMNKFNLLYT